MAALDQAVATLAPAVGTVRACRAVGQPRSGWYRRHRQSPPPPRPPRPTSASQPRALSAAEPQQVLDVLHDERFCDLAPASVYATLLDERLLADAIAAQGVEPAQLTIHADRGSSMTSKPVAMLLADLGVTRSHSRPQVSNDNPYSESQFKTLKHHPTFPDRFGSLQEARGFCQRFFGWYNVEHRHSGIALLTPADVHSHRG